jgi:uncharacterized protein
LIDEETAKIKIMEEYLPAQLGQEELETLVKQAVDEAGSTEFGTVMKVAMAKVAGRADGGAVSAVLKKILA